METVVISSAANRIAPIFQPIKELAPTSQQEIQATYSSAVEPRVWIAENPGLLARSLIGRPRKGKQNLLLWRSPRDPQTISQFHNFFHRVWARPRFEMLPNDEVVEVLASDAPENLFIGGHANMETKTVTLIRGNLEPLDIQFPEFGKDKTSPAPDFSKLKVTDYGQVVKLGKYETSASALLYRFDSTYRRFLKEKKLRLDDSFGASLKRLRLLRGLSQSDFEPEIARRQIIRLENNEIRSPRPATLQALADKLKVHPREIVSY